MSVKDSRQCFNLSDEIKIYPPWSWHMVFAPLSVLREMKIAHSSSHTGMLISLLLIFLCSIFNWLALNKTSKRVIFEQDSPVIRIPLTCTDASRAAPNLGLFFMAHRVPMQMMLSGSHNIRRTLQHWMSLLRFGETKTCQYLGELRQIDPKAWYTVHCALAWHLEIGQQITPSMLRRWDHEGLVPAPSISVTCIFWGVATANSLPLNSIRAQTRRAAAVFWDYQDWQSVVSTRY